jgi:hypothetical protein
MILIRLCILLLGFNLAHSANASNLKQLFSAEPSVGAVILHEVGGVVMPVPHGHPSDIKGAGAAEADRLMAMLAVTDCDLERAEHLFTYAWVHDPDNELLALARAGMQDYLETQSVSYMLEAKILERYALRVDEPFMKTGMDRVLKLLQINDAKVTYLQALECDPSNPVAYDGYVRMWMKQHGDWTLLDRLGYHFSQ